MNTKTNKKYKNINFKIEEELLKQFKIKTTMNNEKMVDVVRKCIIEYIKNN